MQCPTCEHEAPVAEFGDPLRCPECGAFYEKAVQLKAKREAAMLVNQQPQKPTEKGVSDAGGRSAGSRFAMWVAVFVVVTVVVAAVFSRPSSKVDERHVSSAQPAPAARSSNEALSNQSKLRIAQDNVRKRLKDPDSAQFRGLFVSRAGLPCGEVNSKNGFGGYTGYKRFVASGGGLAVIESDMTPEEFEKTWAEVCR